MPNRKSKRFAGGIATAWLAALTVGCAGLDGPKWNLGARRTTDAAADGRSLESNPPKKKDGPPRTQQAIADFERRRNEAQFLAAETDWRQGDAKGCRESLEKILAREPGHRGSILLLADVHLEGDRCAEAVEVLDRGVAALPGDAEIAYKLGVALEAEGLPEESLHWLHQAASKEPSNERYRTALAQAKNAAAADADAAATARATARQATVREATGSPAADPAADPAAAPPATSATEGEATVASPAKFPKIPLADTANQPNVAAPTRSDVEFQAALADWDAGRREACEAKLLQLLADEPKHIDAAILLAEVELSTDRGAEARARVERLVIRNPNDPQIRRACGLTYEALGEKEAAASCFAKAERLEAQPPAPTTTHREWAAREADARKGRVPAELNLADLETTPVDAGAELNLTAAELPTTTNMQGQPAGSARAEGSAQPAESAPSPDLGPSSEPATAPSVLRFESDSRPAASLGGTHTEATPGSPTGDRTKPSAAELLDRGTDALVARDVDAARDAFLAAIRLDRKNSQTAVTAAVAALKHEQPELALQLSTFALETLPRSAGLHRVHGTAAYQLGRLAEAEAALRQSLSLDNSQALSYFLLGSVQSRLGKHEAADGQFRHAARLDRRYAVRR